MAKQTHEKKNEQAIFQEKYLEYNHYKQQIQAMSEELSTLSLSAQALNVAKETVGNFDKLKEGDEIFVPLGAQVFAKAKLSDTKNVLMNVGAGAIVQKGIEKAVNSLEGEQKDVENLSSQLSAGIKELAAKMEKLELELDDFAKKMQKGKQQ